MLLVQVQGRGVDAGRDVSHPGTPTLWRAAEQCVVQLRVAVIDVHSLVESEDFTERPGAGFYWSSDFQHLHERCEF